MKTNIATTIVIGSLLIYVPVAYFAVARRVWSINQSKHI